MTATGIRERLAKLRSHPVSFLLSINIACAVLGLAQFAFTLSVLLPADFAVIGVLAALGGVVIGFLDVKLADLTTKLYYETDKADLSGRAALLSASLWLHLAAGFCTAAATFVVSLLLARRFLSQEMAAWWAAAMAARIGIAFPVTAAVTFMRLTGDFRASGWTRLATQIAVTLATVACLRASPSLSGYFAAVGVGAALSIAGSLAVAARMTGKTLGHPLLAPPSISAFARYRAGSFLVGGSLAGLAKLV
ncbi:MAG TPA: hypothetical protein PK264_19290, partial [Hyphomicrobiaceae bacterium]|nr:hypothetical protein [Hyphomicrobiaceae bacterium]